MTPPERWALLKLGMRTLRIGMSARSVKHVLAEFGGVSVGEIEEVWHAQEPPYLDLFAWLEGRGPKPDCKDAVTFHPVMLAHAIEEAEVETITPAEFMAEWKYDGIRVQVVSTPAGKGLFSRTGDDISAPSPRCSRAWTSRRVLDGELIVKAGDGDRELQPPAAAAQPQIAGPEADRRLSGPHHPLRCAGARRPRPAPAAADGAQGGNGALVRRRAARRRGACPAARLPQPRRSAGAARARPRRPPRRISKG